MTGLRMAGIDLEVGPRERLTAVERTVLVDLDDADDCAPIGAAAPFRLQVRDRLGLRRFASSIDGERPARVTTDRHRVHLSHPAFDADLDPISGHGCLTRDPQDDFPLAVTLRVTLCSRMPLIGRLPVHGAGVVIGSCGVVFFGPSGAGKSTLAATSPYPVVSDELVAVGTTFPTLASAGFFAATGDRIRSVPLRALVELKKGSVFTMRELAPREALASLLSVTMVPPSATLWSASMTCAASLIRDVPVFQMAWSPLDPPWPQILSRLDLDDPIGSPAATKGRPQ